MKSLIITQYSKEDDINKYFSAQEKCISIQIQDINVIELDLVSILSKSLTQQQQVEELKLVICSNCIIDFIELQLICNGIKSLQLLHSLQIDIREKCYLQLEGMYLISDLISSINHIQMFDFSILKSNYIQAEGLISLSNSFQKNPNLLSLSIKIHNDNSISSFGISNFFLGLKNLNCLQDLIIDLKSNHFDENSSFSLGSALKSLQKLKSFNIQLIDINAQTIEKNFAESIGSFTEIQTLIIQIMSPLQVKQEIIQQFISSFKLLSSLIELKVEGLISDYDHQNNIEFANIFKYTTNLRSLHLNITQSNTFSNQLLISYSQSTSFLNNIQSVQLKIHPDTLNSEQGLIDLFQTIKKMRNISSFSISILQDNKLYAQGARIIGETLAELRQLKQLKLTLLQNTFQKNLLTQIAHFIQQLTSLEVLDLVLNYRFSDQEGVEISKSLKFMVNLRELFLDLTNRSKAEVDFYFGLNMDNNPIQKEIVESVKQLKYLKKVNLNKNLKLYDSIDLIRLAAYEDQIFEVDMAYWLQEEFNLEDNEIFLNSLQKVRKLLIILKGCNDIKVQTNGFSFLSKLLNLKELNIQVKFSFLNQNYFLLVASSLFLDNLEKLDIVIENGNIVSDEFVFELFSKLINLKNLKLQLSVADQDNLVQPFSILEQIPLLLNLINLEFYIVDLNNNHKFHALKVLSNLNKLQHLDIDIFKSLDDKEIQELEIAVINLHNLKHLNIKAKNYIFNHIPKNLQNLEKLQYLQTEGQGWLNLFYNRNQEIQQYQQHYPIQLPLKQILFERRTFDYNLKLRNIINLDILFIKQEDYILEQFEQVIDQIKQLQFLNNLSLQFVDSQGQQKWTDILDDNSKNRNEDKHYKLKQIEENTVNKKRYLENLKIIIDNFLFSHYHAFIIGREMRSLNHLQQFNFELKFKNNIGDIGLENIFYQLQYLDKLLDLNILLSNNTYFGEKSAIALGNSLKELKLLQDLKINIGKQQNGLQNGIKLIAQGISKLQNLISLQLEVDNKLQSDLNEECIILKMIGKAENLRKLELDISPHYKIQENRKDYLEKIYQGNQNTYFKLDDQLNTPDQQMIESLNSEIMSLLQKLNQAYIYNTQMLINDNSDTFLDKLVQYYQSTIQIFIMKLIFSFRNYQIQPETQIFDQNQSMMTKIITLFQEKISYSYQVLDIEIRVKKSNSLFDFNEKDSIIICKKSYSQVKIIFLFQIFIQTITQIDYLLQRTQLVIQSFKRLQHLNLKIVSDKELDELQHNNLFKIISKCQFLQYLNLILQVPLSKDNTLSTLILKSIQSLSQLQGLYLDFQESDENAYKLQVKIIKICKRLIFIDCQGGGIRMNDDLD